MGNRQKGTGRREAANADSGEPPTAKLFQHPATAAAVLSWVNLA